MTTQAAAPLFDRSTCVCALSDAPPATCPECCGVGTVPTCPVCGSDVLLIEDGEPCECASCHYPESAGDRADAAEAAREDR